MSGPSDGWPPASKADYGSAAAYADELRKWIIGTQCVSFCHYMATFHALAQVSGGRLVSPLASLVPDGATDQASAIPPRPDRQYIERRTISSFSRRIVAEAIDSLFAFAMKLFIIYILVEVGFMSFRDLDKYDRLLGDEADLQTLIDVTQELFPVEIFAKIIVSIVEAYFISYGLGAVPAGCTPGKAVMGIKVITCLEATAVDGSGDVNIHRTPNIPFKNSLSRSLMKNLLINLLFPLSAAAYAFTFNRALYDIVAKTIVVYM